MKAKPYATNKPVIKLTAVNVGVNGRLSTVFVPAVYDERGKARVGYAYINKVVDSVERKLAAV